MPFKNKQYEGLLIALSIFIEVVISPLNSINLSSFRLVLRGTDHAQYRCVIVEESKSSAHSFFLTSSLRWPCLFLGLKNWQYLFGNDNTRTVPSRLFSKQVTTLNLFHKTIGAAQRKIKLTAEIKINRSRRIFFTLATLWFPSVVSG